MQSRVTIRDVARRAGVHPATVSRALNESTKHVVNAATLVRVVEAARELSYEPDLTARTLRMGRTSTIGVLVPDLTNPLLPPVVRGIQDYLGEHDYATLIGNTDNDPVGEQRAFKALRIRQVDGLIFMANWQDDETFRRLVESGTPVVAVHRPGIAGVIPSVRCNDRFGMTAVVEHLVALGHRRFAAVCGPRAFSTGQVRFRTVEDVLRRHGLALDPEMVHEATDYVEAEGERCAEAILERGRPTAIVAGNDLLAVGCLAALEKHGISCPDEVSVTGFNDIRFAERLAPPLTTVRIPNRLMGTTAAELVLDRLAGRPTPNEVVLDVELIVRRSTAAPPRP